LITSDHGEEFGEHAFFGHAHNTNLDAISVPLVILSPRVPEGRLVSDPVSLRDLPATVVDLLDVSRGAPFSGQSLLADRGLTASGSKISSRPPRKHQSRLQRFRVIASRRARNRSSASK
jgi:arylsulfatase A-like enzyme